MKHLFLIIIIIIQYYSYAQNHIIYGKVFDERGDSLKGVYVSLEKTSISTTTILDGSYRILLPQEKSYVLTFSYIGMDEQKVIISETTKLPLIIKLKDSGLKTDIEMQNYYINSKIRSFQFLFNIESFDADFKEFSEFSQNDITLFNDISYLANIGIGGYYDNIYGSFLYGSDAVSNINEIDSIKTSIELHKIMFSFGYAFPSAHRRFILTPYISFQRLAFKYFTFEDKEKVSLIKYLQSQYYNINFIQYFGIIGADFEVKLFTLKDLYLYCPFYFTLGTGYLLKFSKKPRIKATNNILNSQSNIIYKNVFFQIGMRIHFKFY